MLRGTFQLHRRTEQRKENKAAEFIVINKQIIIFSKRLAYTRTAYISITRTPLGAKS